MQSGTNKLKATVSRVIDDVAKPAFVAPDVPTLVTTRQSRTGPNACHSHRPATPTSSKWTFNGKVNGVEGGTPVIETWWDSVWVSYIMRSSPPQIESLSGEWRGHRGCACEGRKQGRSVVLCVCVCMYVSLAMHRSLLLWCVSLCCDVSEYFWWCVPVLMCLCVCVWYCDCVWPWLYVCMCLCVCLLLYCVVYAIVLFCVCVLLCLHACVLFYCACVCVL